MDGALVLCTAGHNQQMQKRCFRYYLVFLFQFVEFDPVKTRCVSISNEVFITPLFILFTNSFFFQPKFIVILNLVWVPGAEIKI